MTRRSPPRAPSQLAPQLAPQPAPLLAPHLTLLLAPLLAPLLALPLLTACGTEDAAPHASTGGASSGGTAGAPSSGGTAGQGGAPAAVPQRPFGVTQVDYPAGTIVPSGEPAALTAAATAFYDTWKAAYVREACGDGRYVVATAFDDENLTLSEGIGYGMLATAYFAGHDPEAQTIFDGLYRLFRDHPAGSSVDLMAWYLNGDCEPVRGGARDDVSASDGDLDIAYALLLADTQWGSCGTINYRVAAEQVIAAIAAYELDPTQRFVRLGDWPSEEPWTRVMRASDFMPGHFAAFAAATSDPVWSLLTDSLYTSVSTLQELHSPTAGLLPDYILDPAEAPAPASGASFTAEDAAYFWNACRSPWRLGAHFLTTGEARAHAALQPLNTWAKASTGGEPLAFASGYALDGTPLATWDFPSMAFIAPLGVSAMVDAENQAWLDAVWAAVVAAEPEGYFEDSLKLLSMVAMESGWWAPEPSSVTCE